MFRTAKPGHLPSNWLEARKDLLRTFIGRELLSCDPMDVSFGGNCGGSRDPLEELAYHLVHSRSWGDKMVPVFYMVNHGNGHLSNVDTNSAHRGRDIFAFASRDIYAGENCVFEIALVSLVGVGTYKKILRTFPISNFGWYGPPTSSSDRLFRAI